MPIIFDNQNNVGVFTTKGDVDFESGIKVLEDGLLQIKSGEPPYKILFDLRGSTENRSKEDMQDLADFVQAIIGPCAIALVAKDDLLKGMSRMFASYCELRGMQCQVFSKLEESYIWLKNFRTDN